MTKRRGSGRDAYAASFEVPLRFQEQIVGRIELFPDVFRRRVLETRLPEPREDAPGEWGGPTNEEVKQANLLAMAIVLDVQDQLGSGAGDHLIDALSADIFARAGQLTTPEGRHRLSPLGIGALAVPAVREWIEKSLAGQKADDVRHFLQLLTPGKPGRKPQIDREARRLIGMATMAALEPHVQELHRCRNPRSYYLTWKDTKIARRIAEVGLDETWFPTSGRRPPELKRITAKMMAAQLMAAEGHGGAATIRKDLGKRVRSISKTSGSKSGKRKER